MSLPSVLQPFGVEIIQTVDREDLFHGLLEVVFESDEVHFVLFDIHVTGSIVFVSRLPNRTDIDDGFLIFDDRVDPTQLVGQVEIRLIQKDAGDVRVADEADMGNSVEKRPDLHRVGIHVVGEDVLVDWPARRGVNEIDGCLGRTQLGFQGSPHRQLAQKPPTFIALFLVLNGLHDVSRPETGLLGTVVKIRRLVKHGVIVVAQDAPFALFDNQIEAFGGVGAVTDHVAQAIDILDAPPLNIGQDRAQGFNIRMYVTDDGKHRLS